MTSSSFSIASVMRKSAVRAQMFSAFIIPLVTVSATVVTSSAQAQAETATFVLEVRSDSAATRGKNYKVTHYADENCSKRGKTDKVYQKKYAKDVHTFNALEVEADSPFIFQVAYQEKRRGETRACTSAASVSLQAGRLYKAVYQIVDEVIGCNIKIFDTTDGVVDTASVNADTAIEEGIAPNQVEFDKPEYTCKKLGEQGFKNGTPVYSYKDRLG